MVVCRTSFAFKHGYRPQAGLSPVGGWDNLLALAKRVAVGGSKVDKRSSNGSVAVSVVSRAAARQQLKRAEPLDDCGVFVNETALKEQFSDEPVDGKGVFGGEQVLMQEKQEPIKWQQKMMKQSERTIE